jgi:NADH:ubiquinone reductase (H+-translocating)
MPRIGPPRILMAGGGYVGLYAALRLERLLDPGEAELFILNPENFMVYQPLLPEVASGTLEPRHAVVSLRRALRRTHLITGRLEGLDHEARTARISPYDGQAYDFRYDHIVFGLGSMTRMLPIDGLEDHAVGFQTLTEAIHLRNHVLSRMETAESSLENHVRTRALTFVFVGGGYTGVEALGELEDMGRSATQLYPSIRPQDQRWILVEAMDRILPTVSEELSRHALDELRSRGVEVHLETTVERVRDGVVTLSSGEEVAADTLVWVAGVAPHGLVSDLGLPVNDQGLLAVDRYLRCEGSEGAWAGAWAAGDNAAVPDPKGGFYPPTAQHARREARQLAENLAATIRGRALRPFRYSSPGEMITLGRNKGVAEIFGRQPSGTVAWLLRRLYYASQVPTLDRKVRIALDWMIGLPFRRDVVSLGSLEEPRRPIEEAAKEQTDAA